MVLDGLMVCTGLHRSALLCSAHRFRVVGLFSQTSRVTKEIGVTGDERICGRTDSGGRLSLPDVLVGK